MLKIALITALSFQHRTSGFISKAISISSAHGSSHDESKFRSRRAYDDFDHSKYEYDQLNNLSYYKKNSFSYPEPRIEPDSIGPSRFKEETNSSSTDLSPYNGAPPWDQYFS